MQKYNWQQVMNYIDFTINQVYFYATKNGTKIKQNVYAKNAKSILH